MVEVDTDDEAPVAATSSAATEISAPVAAAAAAAETVADKRIADIRARRRARMEGAVAEEQQFGTHS